MLLSIPSREAVKHLPLVALVLALAGIMWQGEAGRRAAYAELRGEVKSLREWAAVEVSHSNSWIDDLKARVRELESRR
jgi:hypothetical protein